MNSMVGDTEPPRDDGGHGLLRAQKAQDLLLLVGEALDEEIYEAYLESFLSSQDLAPLFRLVSEWQRLGEEIVAQLVGGSSGTT